MEISQNKSGLWSDFLTLAGESTFWVSGYTGYALCLSDDGPSLGFLEKAARMIINHQREDGGWSYGLGVPTDADSTSWCLLFLSKLGLVDGIERGGRFLLEHQNPDGGFRTYASPVSVGHYMGLNDSIPFEGWQTSQLCVTGVAAREVHLETPFGSPSDDRGGRLLMPETGISEGGGLLESLLVE